MKANQRITQDDLFAAAGRRDVAFLALHLFGAVLTAKQVEIVRAITYRLHRRLAITAHTRYGKTWCVALAICLLVLLDKRPLQINVVSATRSQAHRMRRYMSDFILACPVLQAHVQLDAKGAERLRKEVSKTRLTFRDGKSITFHTAHGEASSLMGEGGDVNVVDEAGLIKADTYTGKVRRMAGDAPDADLIEVSNPWSRQSEFFKSWQDPGYARIQVGWEDGLAEGRITQDWVDEQRRRLAPLLFTILYDSDFPEDVADALFRWGWIQAALAREHIAPGPLTERRWGLDVAEGGADETVLAEALRDPGRISIVRLQAWKSADTMVTANRVHEAVPDLKERIGVDAIGTGKGVHDRLGPRELGHATHDFKSSRKPRNEKFANVKAEAYWDLRDLLEKGANPDSSEWISLPDDDAPDLVNDLVRARYEVRNGKVYVWHEGDPHSDRRSAAQKVLSEDQAGSPDHSDAVVIAVYEGAPPDASVVKPGVRLAPRSFEPGGLYGLQGKR